MRGAFLGVRRAIGTLLSGGPVGATSQQEGASSRRPQHGAQAAHRHVSPPRATRRSGCCGLEPEPRRSSEGHPHPTGRGLEKVTRRHVDLNSLLWPRSGQPVESLKT